MTANPRTTSKRKKVSESLNERGVFPGDKPMSALEAQDTFIKNFGHDGVPDQPGFADQGEIQPPKERMQINPDGSVCPLGFKPGEKMPDGYALPGRLNLEEQQEGPMEGYRFESHKKPFQIGPMEDLIVDGTAWAKKANEYIQSVSDGLPEMPMIACMIGGIGAGKTTALANLLSVYANENCFNEIHCFSASMGLDPLMLTVQYLRDPNVKMEFHTELDFDFLNKLHDDIQAEYAEYAKLAKIGKFHKKEGRTEVGQRMATAILDTHSRNTPYINPDGTHHGEKLRLPAPSATSSSFMSPLELKMGSSGGPFQTRTCGGFIRKMKTSNAYEYRKAMLESESKLPFAKLFDPTLAQIDKSKEPSLPRNTNLKDLADVALQMNVEDPDYNAVQARHAELTKAMESGSKVMSLNKKEKRTLMVFDDCAYAFHRPGADKFKRWITMIRHTHCAAIFCFQQVTSVPPIVRTCCTHMMLWRVLCSNEMKRLQDEWGGVVPDFLGAYHATTSKQPGHEKDFLFVDLRKGIANRGFAGKVIPQGNSVEDEDEKNSIKKVSRDKLSMRKRKNVLIK